MALQLALTDSDTLAVYPQAYVRIDQVSLTLDQGGNISVGVYANINAANAGGRPIRREAITLTSDEATTLRTNGLALLYGILKGRDEFAAGVDV